MDPSLLFADEPTSGLDSFLAQSVVEAMEVLAKSGRTVLATIHQPSSEVYAMFDKLMLLAEGRVVYFGSREGAIPYFARLGEAYVCPEHFNPADFWLAALAQAKEKEGEIERLAAAWIASPEKDAMD
jgi:ABC-type multidrug transport system ATPase subunit